MSLKEIFNNPDNFTDGEKVGDDKDCIGLYFSAHWCPPCRGFTPKLITYYDERVVKGKSKYEIIFISSDRDENDWSGYAKDMPWKKLKFDKKDIKETLSKKFQISGIPTLVLVDKEGNLINQNGRGQVDQGKDLV